MSFLTVEDVNSVSLNYINEYYELKTSNISEQTFNGVLYDFTIVSHSINGETHTFTFEIHNSLWTGGYYFTKNNGDYLDISASYQNNQLTVTTNESSICLVLYLCSFTNNFNLMKLEYILLDTDVIILNNNDLGKLKEFRFKSLKNNQEFKTNNRLIKGVLEWRS